jgi:hypothetical protein
LGNFALNFVKNLITERGFKKNDFGAIVGLSNQKSIDTAQESPVAKKAKRRLKQIAIATASVLLASMALVRFGHEIPALAQRSKRFQKPLQSLSRFLEWAADQLEFDFKPRKTGQGESTFFDLGRNHLKIIVPAAMLGYVDAARDKLERVEVASRVSVTGTYIAFIQPWLADLFNRKFGERFKDLGVMKGEKLSDVKTLEELQADCVQLAKKALGHAASDEAISTEAAKHLKPRLAAKSQLFFIPYLFGILVIGFFTALMNQLWTRHRFGQMLAERQSTLKFDPTWHPFTQRKPYITSAPPNHTNLQQSYTREKDYAALLNTLSLPTPKALQAST